MKNTKHFLFYSLFIVVLFSACDDFEDTPPQTENEYFVSEQRISTYTVGQMNTMLNLSATFYPELGDMITPLAQYLESDVEIFKITYNTKFNNEDIIASGIVSIPKSSGSYPVISFQNGTNTLHSEAPSESDYTLLSENNLPLKLLSAMASTGFVIVIPDYLGFGESDDMFHPYLDKTSTVQCVLDMLKAVEEMIESKENIELNNNLYINGYSQGGWATMAVQEAIEQQNAGNFNLKASACGGGPHKLVDFMDFLLEEPTYPMPYFPAYLYNSYMNLGLETPGDSIFQEPYAEKIPTLFNGLKTGGEINSELTTDVSALFTANFIENHNNGGIYQHLTTMLNANSNHGYSTTVPTLLIHGTADNYVPASQSEALYQEFINEGVSQNLIELMLLPDLDHTDAVIPAELTSIKWFIELEKGVEI